MTRPFVALFIAALVAGCGDRPEGSADKPGAERKTKSGRRLPPRPETPRPGDADPEAFVLVGKAVLILGGEEKLAALKAVSWVAKCKMTGGDTEDTYTSRVTVQGFDRYREATAGAAGNGTTAAVTVLAGDKGWWKDGDEVEEMGEDEVAEEKRGVSLRMLAISPLPLMGNGYGLKMIPDQSVGGVAAAGIKVTRPDGTAFEMYFDKTTGRPVRQVAAVTDDDGKTRTEVTTLSAFKPFAGIQKATRLETTRDGKKFLDQEITEFKLLDGVDAETFAMPKK